MGLPVWYKVLQRQSYISARDISDEDVLCIPFRFFDLTVLLFIFLVVFFFICFFFFNYVVCFSYQFFLWSEKEKKRKNFIDWLLNCYTLKTLLATGWDVCFEFFFNLICRFGDDLLQLVKTGSIGVICEVFICLNVWVFIIVWLAPVSNNSVISLFILS